MNKSTSPEDQDVKVTYQIPLLQFERQLILDVERFLSEPGSNNQHGPDSSTSDAFHKWRWFREVSGWMKGDLDPEEYKQYGGDRSLAYDRCFQALANLDSPTNSHLYRMNAVRDANRGFVDRLGDQPTSEIQFEWLEEDGQFWEILSKIVNVFGKPWRCFDDISDDFVEEFEIWQLVRVFFLHSLFPNNANEIRHNFINDPGFAACYSVGEDDSVSGESPSSHQFGTGAFTQLVIRKRHNPTDQLDVSHSLDEGSDGDDGNSNTDDTIDQGPLDLLGPILRQAGAQRRYRDPRAYLHFIPWESLTEVSQGALGDGGVELDLLLDHIPQVAGWVLWEPPLTTYGINHHLHVEDEIFAYNIERDWPLPGHYLGNKVVFGLLPLPTSHLIERIGQFWVDLNDCAITKKGEGEVYVLRTIPGLQFGVRKDHLDYQAALAYYRNITDAHLTSSREHSSVKEAVGLESGYRPLYEHSLRLIPFDEIQGLDWNRPLGTGANGAVYAAEWHRPSGGLASLPSGHIAVAIKDTTSNSPQSRTKFMKELDATWYALGGWARSCVPFFGITVTDSERLMLVSERATQGAVRDFLEREVRRLDSFLDSWKLLSETLSGIASGLDWIHQHDVVHRDLHVNNILVTDRTYRLDPTIPHEFDYLIGDLGEGKRLGLFSQSAQDHRHATYGAIEYRAPEQIQPESQRGNDDEDAKAAEVFSFGVVVCKLLDCRFYSSSSSSVSAPARIREEAGGIKNLPEKHEYEHEQERFIVPRKVREAVRSCLAGEPSVRPQMAKVSRTLEDLTCAFSHDKVYPNEPREVKWCFWDWDESLNLGRRGAALLLSKRDETSTGSGGSYDEFDV